MTPLQGALIAASVANGGSQMRPYLVDSCSARTAARLYTAEPQELRQPVSRQVAEDLQDMMVSVVENGTGKKGRRSAASRSAARPAPRRTATTARPRLVHRLRHARTASRSSAVCVMLENAGSGGSAEAARIAGQIMQAAIAARGG